jgi:hypothetical protein
MERTLALFEILEVPYSTQYSQLSDDGITAIDQLTLTNAQAQVKILAWITSMSAEVGAVLESLLDTWIDLGTDASTQRDGAIGNITGLTDDVNAEREVIRRKVFIIVPYWRVQDRLGKSSIGVSLIR